MKKKVSSKIVYKLLFSSEGTRLVKNYRGLFKTLQNANFNNLQLSEKS